MKKGFTLVELMIVVAIIAFLAVVSVPSFKKFLSKSKRTEAYMNLSALATAQKIYWAEHGTYSDDLQAVGWKPEGRALYTYGFAGMPGKHYIPGSAGNFTAELAASKADKQAFRALAVGDIDGDGKPDVLSVDQNSTIEIMQDDLQ